MKNQRELGDGKFVLKVNEMFARANVPVDE